MRNYSQTENTITVTAPSAVSSGDLVVVGAIVGVAQADAASGDPVALVRRGVFRLPKATGFAPGVGTPAKWDDADDRLESAGTRIIGVYAESAVSGDVEALVILDPALGERQVVVERVFIRPAANATVQAAIKAPFDGDHSAISYYTGAKPASTLGTCTLAVNSGGNTLLNAANVDAEAFTDDAETALTLTATTAHRAVTAGQITTVTVVSNNADLVPGEGITVFVAYARG
jgi:predicted RecA/RadA family phage recombinase